MNLYITERRRAEQFRQGYVHTISHDLRTPLTVILAEAQLLERASARVAWGGQDSRRVKHIVTAAQSMNMMIQDLVDSARQESRQLLLEKRTTDLRPFVCDLLERSAPVIDVKRIRLEIPPDLPPLLADQNRLERMLINLVSNALKYSLQETEVLVSAEKLEGEVIVSVADNGAGIIPEDLPHIFERFYMPQRGRKPGGLGMGLYITKILAEAHGGHIWAKSEPGTGTTICFTMPFADAYERSVSMRDVAIGKRMSS